MENEFLEMILAKHRECPLCPSKEEVNLFFVNLMGILFPNFSRRRLSSLRQLNAYYLNLKDELYNLLRAKVEEDNHEAEAKTQGFFERIPQVHEKLEQDIIAMFEGDPAASSKNEIIRSYPGFYAIAAYRFAHELLKLDVKVIPRMITEHAHSITGIDIHPGANIGQRFCIDHGTGIVIGETTEIGNNVKIYQGVTLGALSVNKEDASSKRHPTIEDNVVIYAAATILGGKTVIGANSIIGGNVWITRSIAPNSKIYYQSKMYDDTQDQTDIVIYKEI